MRQLNTKQSCYLASGWFNNDQERTRLAIQVELEKNGISYFSPKDEVVVKATDGPEVYKAVFKGNIDAIHECTFMIVNTAGKDMGTLFECGYAAATNIPIIFYFEPPTPEAKFNIMLASTGVRVVSNQKELGEVLKTLVDTNFDFESIRQSFTGKVE